MNTAPIPILVVDDEEPIRNGGWRAHHERPLAHRLPVLTRDRTEPNLAHPGRGRG